MAKLAPGRVRDAIKHTLSYAKGSLSVQEIVAGVTAQLGRPVSPSSVRSYLRLNVGRDFKRPGKGAYALRGLAEDRVPYQLDFATPDTSGSFKLVLDDCMNWLTAQKANSIHAVITDPPYGLVEYSAREQEKLRRGKGGVWRIPPKFDGHQRSPLPRFTTLTERDLAALEAYFAAWAKKLMRVLVPGANVIVASNPLLSDRVSRAMAASGLERRGEVVRLVMTMRGGDRPKNAHHEFPDVSVMPRSMWEPWLTFRKPLDGRVQDNLRRWKTGGFRRISTDQPFGDVIQSHPTTAGERKLAPHPSLKPQSFLRKIVRASLPMGEGVVLDPFAGSGSTVAAAVAVGYRSIGIERDPHYYSVAERAITHLSRLRI